VTGSGTASEAAFVIPEAIMRFDVRRHVRFSTYLAFDLIRRVPAFAIELVGKGDDRHVAQPADLKELAGLLLDALGGVEHHRRPVDRGQGAVGVLAEILVARHVKQVEGEPPARSFGGTMRGRHSPIAKEAQEVILDAEPTGDSGARVPPPAG
jgi:hypothetical protein